MATIYAGCSVHRPILSFPFLLLQDTVFDPVSLSCGHIFCYLCCCSAASVTIVDGLKSADHKSKCPLCRQVNKLLFNFNEQILGHCPANDSTFIAARGLSWCCAPGWTQHATEPQVSAPIQLQLPRINEWQKTALFFVSWLCITNTSNC